MKTSDQIKVLEQQLATLHQKQRACKHQWGTVQFDPEEYQEATGYHYEGCGSDPYLVANGYMTRHKDRWSRECTECGWKEYTTTQEPTAYKPKF